MHKKITLLAALTLALVGCKEETEQAKRVADTNLNAELQTKAIIEDKGTQDANAVDSMNCPSEDFELFLKSYSHSSEIQKSFTSIPLESMSIDPLAELEPAEVSKILSANELSFPLIPSLSQQKRDGLMSRISYADEKNVEVMLYKPDTDYQMSFSFKRESCWMLYRIKDYSL